MNAVEKMLENDPEYIKTQMGSALIKEEITDEYLAKKLKGELKAKRSELIKIRGAIAQESLPKGYKLIAVSGTLAYSKDGDEIFGDGESLIERKVPDRQIQQKGRQDTHKLRGDYPAEKYEHSGNVTIEVVNYADKDTSELQS
jgi:hypothetical protein